ncbi:dihydrofolate reductase family protein [Nakamurella alba]|uniref:dihydrofolate reductase family protein n=1 Tax=Nakamurella alba TaxID=2665158 RepID=UPI002AC31751|nr:dihydrofolate reductase family protein [Nakamurella alba]
MRRLVTNTFITLDGVLQSPGGPEEDPEHFTAGGWSVPHWDEAMGEVMAGYMESFALVLGRRTYDLMAAYWPTAPDHEQPDTMNNARKYVVSRGRPTLTWQHAELLDGDPVNSLTALKQTDGPELQVHGSGDLLQTLLQHPGLVDELRIWTFPVLVGSGKRMFADRETPTDLRLVRSRTFDTGVVHSVYRPTGAFSAGAF